MIRTLALIIAGYALCGLELFSAARQNSPSKTPDDLVTQLIADINNNKKAFHLSTDDLKVLHKNLRYETHDLNGDRVPEFFLYIDNSDWCGAGSNCTYWIYQKTGEGYKLLLEDKELRVRDKITNGYRDLASETPMGFCERNVQKLYVTPYKYDGAKYQAQQLEVDCRAFVPKKN